MIRFRIFLGILTLVLLLWGVGVSSYLLVSEASKRFDTTLREQYEAVQDAQSFRTITSAINTIYLTTLASPAGDRTPDRSAYDLNIAKMDDTLLSLQKVASDNNRWERQLMDLEIVIEAYKNSLEAAVSGEVESADERGKLLEGAGVQTQRITDLSGSLRAVAEEKMFAQTRAISRSTLRNLSYVLLFVVIGTCAGLLLYNQLIRQFVLPMISLKTSMEEVGEGNLESHLDVPRGGGEFGKLVTAFNAMAAELRLRRGEMTEKLARENMMNRALLVATPSPVYLLDASTAPVEINPAAEELNHQLALGNRLPQKIERLMKRCVTEGENHLPDDPREAVLFRVDDKEVFYLPRIFRVTTDLHQSGGWAVQLQDVTRIRWLDDMKTNLLSTVSHEIKTPLTGIRMVLHLMLEDEHLRSNSATLRMLESANDDCERLLTTLNNLLDLSRAESGTTQLERAACSLRPLCERAVNMVATDAMEKSVKIVIEEEPKLPDVFADQVRLIEVIQHLLSNAMRYSPRGGSILLNLERADPDYVRLRISDEGCGVPHGYEQRIFERFFRAPNETEGGVGLGLFISREIIRAHEGRIGVMDQTEKQTTEFYIDVPIA